MGKILRMMQENSQERGKLQISVNSTVRNRPIAGARIAISYTGDPGNTLEELVTDESGRPWSTAWSPRSISPTRSTP